MYFPILKGEHPMKKVSLLLAVLLVLTCCLLAACGGGEEESAASEDVSSATETSSEAAVSDETSSEAESADESTVVDESSVVEESSEPDESSVVDESSEEEPPAGYDGDVIENTDGANLALNKSYTGAAPSAHPDVAKYNANLTDGKANDTISYDGEWFAFYMNADATGEGYVNAPDRVGVVVIDLENVYNVSKVQINAFLGNASGIVAPASLKVEVSADGTSYTQLGSIDISKPEENDVTVDWVVIEGGAVAGQYVRVTVTMDAYAPFAFLNEIEVY